MVMDTQDYRGYPVPQDRGPAEPQLDGPSEGEMEAPATLIVADPGTAVKGMAASDWAPDPGKQAYLDRIAPAVLTANADNLIGELADARARVFDARQALQRATEVGEHVEAMHILSDAYSAGKNAEIRAAWLRLQWDTDPDCIGVLSMQRERRQDLETQERALDAITRQYDLAKLEIRLAIASLHFLAGGD